MKIGFFITARLKSTRLKQKILLKLNGRSILDRVIERCKAVEGIDGVVLCTSTNPEDSILYDNALRNSIQFYPGSEDDVLNRLCNAAEYYGYDGLLSITADNPLFSIYISQIIVDLYKKENFDFLFVKELPIGCSPYFLSFNALKIVNYMKKESDTEIWGPFVYRSDFFNIIELIVTNSPFNNCKRLTCDYMEDYQLLQKIYSHFDEDHIPETTEVFDILKRDSSLWEINSNCEQKKVTEKKLTEINRHFDIQKQKGIDFAKKLSIELKPGHKMIEVKI